MGDMFQQEMDEIFEVLISVYIIADDIIIVGYDDDGRKHYSTLRQVM